MSVEQAFGQILKELRSSRKISQEKLALECNLDRTFISLMERGLRQPSLSTILEISKALEIAPDELMRQIVNKLELTA